MPIISDRSTIIQLANKFLAARRCNDKLEAALLALTQHYKLAPGDGIWGRSEAAICMGFMDRNDDQDLLEEIANSVIPELYIPVFSTGQRVFVRTDDLGTRWTAAQFSEYRPASPGRNELYYFTCGRGNFVVKAADLNERVRTEQQHQQALAEAA
jgi:hypothetical protein